METVFLLVIIFSILFELFSKDEKHKKIVFVSLFVFLTIVSCLRSYNVGTDTGLYYSTYNGIAEMPFEKILSVRFELGYTLLCKALGFLFKNPQIIIIVSSLITNIAVYKFIKNNTKNKLLASILYVTLNYYFCYICLVRQGIALAFILFAFEALKNNNNKLFFLNILLATSFHMSAIVFVLMYFLRKKNMKKIIPVTIVGSMMAFLLISWIVNMAMSMLGIYDKYLGTEYLSPSYVSAGLYSLSSFVILMFGLCIPSKKQIENTSKNTFHNFNGWLLAIGTIISVASMRVSILNRIYLYFGFFGIIWLANSLEAINTYDSPESRRKVRVWKVLIYLASLLYVYVITRLNWFGVLPYEVFWNA